MIRSVDCGNTTSPIATATVSQLSRRAAIILRRLHDEAKTSSEDTGNLLPLLDALALETTQCQHVNVSGVLADALVLFRDDEFDKERKCDVITAACTSKCSTC